MSWKKLSKVVVHINERREEPHLAFLNTAIMSVPNSMVSQ